jgi:hypothetical protein
LASHWQRALALLGCVALGGLVVRMLAERSDDDTSLIVEGPHLPADSVQVELHALQPRQESPPQEVAMPTSRRALWSEADAGVSARLPEPALLPEAPARPRPALAPLEELSAPPAALEELSAPPAALEELSAPPAPLEEVPAPPAPALEQEPTTDAGTTSAAAAKAAPPPLPPPLRGTNNAPIFD